MGTASKRFEQYVSLIAQQLGHSDRVEPFRGYCTGLLLPVQRKSVEPMAAHLAPTRVRSEHQRLHHFVADAAWSDDAVLTAVRDYVLVVVEKGPSSFGAYVPDLPGCIAAGETREEVLTLIHEAIEFHLEGLKEDGQPIPPPSSSSEVIEVATLYIGI
jgi:predicted RNase H-like HicB family nuclease